MGEATWEQPVKTLILSGLNFKGYNNKEYYQALSNTRGKGSSSLYTPINLPVGSTIQNIVIYYTDRMDDYDIAFTLSKNSVDIEESESITLLTSTGSVGDAIQSFMYNDPIEIEANKSYHVTIYCSDLLGDYTEWPPLGLSLTPLTVRAIKITYTE